MKSYFLENFDKKCGALSLNTYLEKNGKMQYSNNQNLMHFFPLYPNKIIARLIFNTKITNLDILMCKKQEKTQFKNSNVGGKQVKIISRCQISENYDFSTYHSCKCRNSLLKSLEHAFGSIVFLGHSGQRDFVDKIIERQSHVKSVMNTQVSCIGSHLEVNGTYILKLKIIC